MPLNNKLQKQYMGLFEYTKKVFSDVFNNNVVLIDEEIDNTIRGCYSLKYNYNNGEFIIDFDCERGFFGIGFINEKKESEGLQGECLFDDTLSKENIKYAIIKLKECLHNKNYVLYYCNYKNVYYRRKGNNFVYFDNQKDFFDDVNNFKNYSQ